MAKSKRRKKSPRDRRYDQIAQTQKIVRRTRKDPTSAQRFCIITGKTRYLTEAACWQAIKAQGNLRLCVPYLCLECHAHHQTSRKDTYERRWREREQDI